jgi:protein phosphatase
VDNITVVAFRVDKAGASAPAPPVTEPEEDDPGATVITEAVDPASIEPAEEPDTPPAAKPQTAAAGANGHVPPDVRSARAADQRYAQTRKSRRWVGGIIAAVVIVVGIGGAIVGSLNVYFLGGNEKGLVTVFRGLPYDLPLGIQLYTRDYVTTTPVTQLTAAERAKILDHKLRTRGDALDLAGQIERGDINTETLDSGGGSSGTP